MKRKYMSYTTKIMNIIAFVCLISTLLFPYDSYGKNSMEECCYPLIENTEFTTNESINVLQNTAIATPSLEDARLALAYIHYFETCVYKIEKYQSILVLDNEYNQLYDNMDLKKLSNDPDFVAFNSTLQQTIGDMQLTEEERRVVNRTLQLSNRGKVWNSLSSALSPTYILTSRNPYEIAFQAVLAASRTYVEYKASELESQSDELKFMWQNRKQQLKNIQAIQIQLRSWETSIFRKYPQLQNKHHISQRVFHDYYNILSLKNVDDRIDKLESIRTTGIDVLDEYHYQLGLCYLEKYHKHTKDSAEYLKKAKAKFDIFKNRRGKKQIFEIDNALGTIALFELVHGNNERANTLKLIESVKKNLPYNGAAWLECSMIYSKKLNDNNHAFELLRDAILTDKMSDKDALVMFAVSIYPKIAANTSLCESMMRAVKRCKEISVNSKICFDISCNKSGKYPNYINFYDATTKIPFFYPTWDKSFDVKFYDNYSANLDSIRVFKQSFEDGKTEIVEYSMSYKNAKSKEVINKDVDCFEANSDLMHLFFDKVSNSNIYVVKPNLNYADILNGKFEGLENFTLSTNDKEDIVDYCKKCSKERGFVHLQQKKDGDAKYMKNNIVKYYGKKPNYNPKTKKIANTPEKCNECIVVVYSGLRKGVFTYFVDESNTVKLHSVVKE